MIKMGINKSRGFTLIELMVVIAIISLLSAVVLASLKGAREKAMLTKTVGEMKSLQNALELYRNQFGVYPGVDDAWYTDDLQVGEFVGSAGAGIVQFIQDNLVVNKFLSKTLSSPKYPNNCADYMNCLNNGFVLGYSKVSPPAADWYYVCGGQKVNNYFIYFHANTKKLNLPYFQTWNNVDGLTDYTPGYNTYCLSM